MKMVIQEKQDNGKRIWKKAFFLFKLYYLIYVLLAFNAFVNETRWMGYASYLLTAAGGILFLYMARQYREYFNMCNIRLLAAFLLSYILSSVLNYQYGVVNNGKELVWLLLLMIVVYASGFDSTAEERKREFSVFAAVWIVYCTAVNAVSISMLVWGRKYKVFFGENAAEYKEVGFKWGRLWGMYDDPNHGATIAAAAVILALYLIWVSKEKAWKRLAACSLVIQFFYIVLSDSRTGLVSLGTGVFVWTAIIFCRRRRKKGDSWHRAAGTGLVAGLALVLVLSGAAEICRQQYRVLDKKLVALLPEEWSDSGEDGRKQDLEKDTSNGRIDIWRSGFEIAQTAPVFGVSFRNIVPYAEEHLPKTYLIHNEMEVKYDSLHNSVMDILVSQGAVGIVLMLAIVGNTLLLLKKKLFLIQKENQNMAAVCFTGIAAMGTGCLFLSMVFYLNAPQAFFFWLCLGDFVTILQKAEKTG